MKSNLFQAIAIILFGIVAFDIMAVTVRMLGSEYPILQISVLRNIFGVIPALLLLIIGPKNSSLRSIFNKHHMRIIMIRSIAVLVAQFSYYISRYIPSLQQPPHSDLQAHFYVTLAINARSSNRLHKICCYHNWVLGGNKSFILMTASHFGCCYPCWLALVMDYRVF